jgi:long-chain fatty acid transport protein
MGGVGVGATLDGASLLSNPAGIADLGHRLDVTFSWFNPTVSYTATGTPMGAPMPPSLVAKDGGSIDSDRGGSPLPAIGWVRPLSESLAVGVGVFGVAGMGVDYTPNLYLSPTLTSYLQGRLTPGAAYKFANGLAVGVTANVMMAQMKYDVANAFAQFEHDTATSFGIGATVGVKYSPIQMVTLGAAYETRSYFQDFEFDVPAHNTPAGPLPGGTDKLDFDQPMSATVGVSVKPIEMLLLAADVQWINWSDTMGEGKPKYTNDTNATTGSMPFDMRWDDQWVLKFGAQVTPMKGLDLRAGYNYGKMPLDPSRAFENMAFPAVVEHHITAGAGYQVTERLALNVAGMYAPESKLSGANAGFPPPMGTGQAIQSYSTEMSQFQIDVGASYRF